MPSTFMNVRNDFTRRPIGLLSFCMTLSYGNGNVLHTVL